MPERKQPAGSSQPAEAAPIKGELLGKNDTLRRSTIAAMPGVIPEHEQGEHPHVTINGVVYAWEPGYEDGIPDEALAVWQRSKEANL